MSPKVTAVVNYKTSGASRASRIKVLCLVRRLHIFSGMRAHPAGRPSREEAKRRRVALIARLGAVCQDGFCFEVTRLEFDHINGRDWTPSALSALQRILRYEADAAAGLLRLLCRAHNAKDGGYRRWKRSART